MDYFPPQPGQLSVDYSGMPQNKEQKDKCNSAYKCCSKSTWPKILERSIQYKQNFHISYNIYLNSMLERESVFFF